MKNIILIALGLLAGCGEAPAPKPACKPSPVICHFDAAQYGALPTAPGATPAIAGHLLQFAYRLRVGDMPKHAQVEGPMPAVYPCAHWEIFSYDLSKLNLVRVVRDDDPKAACEYAPPGLLVQP